MNKFCSVTVTVSSYRRSCVHGCPTLRSTSNRPWNIHESKRRLTIPWWGSYMSIRTPRQVDSLFVRPSASMNEHGVVKSVRGGHRALRIMINQLVFQDLLKIDPAYKKWGQRSRRDVMVKRLPTAEVCQPLLKNVARLSISIFCTILISFLLLKLDCLSSIHRKRIFLCLQILLSSHKRDDSARLNRAPFLHVSYTKP